MLLRADDAPTCMPKAWNAATSAAVKEALGDRAQVMLTARISDADTADGSYATV